MVTASLIAFWGIMMFMGLKSSYYIFKVLAGIAAWGVGIWWIYAPIGGNASGTPQAIMIVLVFIVGVSCFFWSFWSPKYANGQEVGGRFRMPFMKTDEQEEGERQRTRHVTMAERNDAYRQRVNGALQGRVRSRRY